VTAPTRTPTEVLQWRLADALAQAERLAEVERQGGTDPQGARVLAELVASASGEAARVSSEHLHRWSAGRGRRAQERVVGTGGGR
jgi:hypothetical protein